MSTETRTEAQEDAAVEAVARESRFETTAAEARRMNVTERIPAPSEQGQAAVLDAARRAQGIPDIKAATDPTILDGPAKREPNKPTLYHVYRELELTDEQSQPELFGAQPRPRGLAWVCDVEDHSRERAILSVWGHLVEKAGQERLPELLGTRLVAVADSSLKFEEPKADLKPRLSL